MVNNINQDLMSKQDTLRQFILNDIKNGILKPGDRIDSRSEFMQKFNCARGTADQAIQRLIKDGALISEKGKGTFVAAQTREAIAGHLSIIIRKQQATNLTSVILQNFLMTIGNSYKTITYSYEDLRQTTTWRECKKNTALIFLLPDAENEPFLTETRREKIPHLVIYRDPPESPFVSLNNTAGASGLIDQFAKVGCKKIAFAAWRQSRYHFAEQIFTGYLEGLLKNKLDYYPEIANFCRLDDEDKLLEDIFKQKPDGLLFYGIPFAKILNISLKNNLKIGHDFFLGNYNYVNYGEYPVPMFSPTPIEDKIGIESAYQIAKIIKNPEIFPQIYKTPPCNSI